jgi:hypothetical protein
VTVLQGAQRYLVERLSVARSRPDQIDVLAWRKQMLGGFGGALEALRAAEMVSADEVADWTNRMHMALGLAPLEPLPPGFQGGRAVYIGEGEPPPPPAAPPDSRFLELIPVRLADQPVPFGGRVQILGIERYDTKVAVTWRLAPLPDPELQFARELFDHERDSEGLPDTERQMLRRQMLHRLSRGGPELSLSDDLHTDYRHTGGGRSGSGMETMGRDHLMPAVPEHATMLTVHWGDLGFPVALT